MQLTPRRHELLSVYMLGAGTLFLYLGYIMQGFISEAVIHAVSERYPGRISRLAGYYGQAFHYTAFATSSLITPSIQSYVSSKWILTLASILFGIYYLGFIHVNYIYFYISQALMGFITMVKARTCLNIRPDGLSNQIRALKRQSVTADWISDRPILPSQSYTDGSGRTAASQSYTDAQIHLIYGTFFALNMISVVIFVCLPTKQYDSIASKSQEVVPSLKEQFGKFKSSVTEVNMLLLTPFFGYMGLIVSFLIGAVYRIHTCFSHSALSPDILYCCSLPVFANGISRDFWYATFINSGVVLRRLIKKCHDWGLIVTITMHFLAVSSALVLIVLSVPDMATIEPTSAPTLLIKPSRAVVAVVGFLMGMGDFTITMGRAVICQVAVPNARMQVFSLSRLYP
ncbi:hypothetical protein OSTOST_16408, partial [Ostertagia ostertagi]